MTERIVAVADVPEGTICVSCDHKNGDITPGGYPFVQKFVVQDEGTEDERWDHIGCLMDNARAMQKHYDAMRDTWGGTGRPYRVREAG